MKIPARFATTAERIGWTAIESFLGILLAAGLLDLDVTVLQSAAASAIAAGLVIVKDFARGELRRLDTTVPPDTSGWVDDPGTDTGPPAVGTSTESRWTVDELRDLIHGRREKDSGDV